MIIKLTHPLISCICITKNRPDQLLKAIVSFDAQGYPNKELVISYLRNDIETINVIDNVKKNSDINIVPLERSDETSIGMARNDAIENCHGDYVCQWDDDDRYYRSRLYDQYNLMQQNGKNYQASILTHILLYDSFKQQAYVSFFDYWGCSLLCKKTYLLQYPYADTSHHEYIPIMEFLISRKSFYEIEFSPSLYTFIYHGDNILPYSEFKNFIKKSDLMDQYFAQDIREQLSLKIDLNACDQPVVSCILPTANRQKYIPFAIDYFLQQDYPNKELVIIDDGKVPVSPLIPDDKRIRYFYTAPLGTIGVKRNYACEKANGEIIMHWDDDDWHANDWISKQVDFLSTSGADIFGIEHVNFYSPIADIFWKGTALNRNHFSNPAQWLNGATLAYWKSFWATHPFPDQQEGEDDAFVLKSGAKVFAHDYIDGFVALLHGTNTTVKYFENQKHKRRL